MRTARMLVAAVGCCALTAAASALSVIPKMAMEEVYSAADDVVHGRVVSQSSRWENVDGNRIIFTYSDVEVYSSIKGQGARNVRVRTVGGSVDGYNQALVGEAAMNPGEEVVLFLGREKGWKEPAVVGFYQGKYKVDRTAGFTQLVRDEGQQPGATPKVDKVSPKDSFVSRLANTREEQGPQAHDHVAQLVRVRQADELDFELARFARTIERGTFSADINYDGRVDRDDLKSFVDAFASKSLDADVNADGIVDRADMQELIREINR